MQLELGMEYTETQPEQLRENPAFLTEQLITYIGNKRALLDFIGQGIAMVQKRLEKEKLDTFDVFSGSGIVSRYLKRYSKTLYTNDLENYAALINQCYLTNTSEFNSGQFTEIYDGICCQLDAGSLHDGLISELYAPHDDRSIQAEERVFYTRRNAQYLDTARRLIQGVPQDFQKYLLAPLLSEASIHANTSGVFKGFYKNSDTGLGQFGGKNKDALARIMSDIRLPYPLFSNFECEYQVLQGDSNSICEKIPELDLAYLDPPYNQHPYGSNYFMLNLLLDYKKPSALSEVSGIPEDWNRSNYNKARFAYAALKELVEKIRSKYLLISFNSEGFISLEEMSKLLQEQGKLTVLETKYNTFRGSRNLSGRQMHVKEYLYLLEKT
ncbi:DNA adenine methylase [Treponema sp.]